MARINITENQALAAVVALLRASLGFDESTCYEVASADAVPSVPIAGDWWCTVSAADGQFVQGEQDPSQLTEETEFIVTAYTRILTDQTDHAENLLHDPARGCLYMKRKLLSALVGKDLVTSTGDTFLREHVWAARSSPAMTGEHSESKDLIGRIQVTFRISYDWDLEQL